MRLKSLFMQKWHCLSEKYNKFIVFVNSVENETGGKGKRYSNWDENGNN